MLQNKRNKIVIIGSSIIILILLAVGTVIRYKQQDPLEEKKKEMVETRHEITWAEVYELFAYFDYSYDELKELSVLYGSELEGDNLYGFALYKEGYIDRDQVKQASKTVLPEELKILLSAYATSQKPYAKAFSAGENRIELQSKDASLSEKDPQSSQQNESITMTLPEFLIIYDEILEALPEEIMGEGNYPQRKHLLVLGERTDTKESKMVVTQDGSYYCEETKNYMDFYPEQEGTTATIHINQMDFNPYYGKVLSCIVFDERIIYTRSIEEKAIQLTNVYIKRGKGTKIEAFVQGTDQVFETVYPLSKEIGNVVGDITVENHTVIKVNIKPDIISGKVLLTNEDYIEVENYGRLDLAEDFRIYKLYDEISMERVNRILVGYHTADFVISDGKICAALLKEKLSAKNIRVLLMTDRFTSIYHDAIEISCSGPFEVSYGDESIEYKANEVFSIQKGDSRLISQRIYVTPKSNSDKLMLQSIKRSDGQPSYRGHMEIIQNETGMFILNELPIEEYLYAVLPSEMPSYYGKEALKVQAVCARSYAYAQLLSNSYAEYGAHVDDSVSYQVYNNIFETESSIEAVKETFGQVISYNGNIINAYYYSTSAGHSNSVEDVWIGSGAAEYLTGKWQLPSNQTVEAMSITEKAKNYDLSKEEDFSEFLIDDTLPVYDKDVTWYRWKVTLDLDTLSRNLDTRLKKRYAANPEQILTLISEKGVEEAVYESREITSVGTIKNIIVGSRAQSGMLKEIILEGSRATIKVISEYNIRYVLAPDTEVLITRDGDEKSDLGLLPSAYISWELVSETEKPSLTLHGAGYGHGVGMSQNGVRAMAKEGKSYDEMIEYYYQGTDITDIYE